MKFKHLVLAAGLIILGFFYYSCTKNSNPQPPVHDTVTVHKTDTLLIQQKIDTPDVKSGLVLYLPFNGSFADSSGLGSTVTSIGGAALDYDMHGYANSAFSSTGNGANLIVGNSGAYAVDTAFSISLDFMIRSNAYYNGGGNYNGLMTFVSIVDPSNGNGPTFELGLILPGLTQDVCFGLNSSSSSCNSPGSGNPQNYNDTTNFAPQLGSWYNLIATFTKGTETVYVNGRLISTKTGGMSSVLFCPNAHFVVGAWWGNTENINGKIDEVRFYNRTLNAQQIAWLSRNFQTTSTKVTPGVRTR